LIGMSLIFLQIRTGSFALDNIEHEEWFSNMPPSNITVANENLVNLKLHIT